MPGRQHSGVRPVLPGPHHSVRQWNRRATRPVLPTRCPVCEASATGRNAGAGYLPQRNGGAGRTTMPDTQTNTATSRLRRVDIVRADECASPLAGLDLELDQSGGAGVDDHVFPADHRGGDHRDGGRETRRGVRARPAGWFDRRPHVSGPPPRSKACSFCFARSYSKQVEGTFDRSEEYA